MSSESGRILAAALLALGVAGYVEGLDRLRLHERAARDRTGPWFGYARDGVNIAAGAVIACAFAIAGLGGPASLLAGVALCLLANVLDFAAGRWLALRAHRALVACAAGAVGLALIAAAPAVAAALDALLAAAAPAGPGAK